MTNLYMENVPSLFHFVILKTPTIWHWSSSLGVSHNTSVSYIPDGSKESIFIRFSFMEYAGWRCALSGGNTPNRHTRTGQRRLTAHSQNAGEGITFEIRRQHEHS